MTEEIKKQMTEEEVVKVHETLSKNAKVNDDGRSIEEIQEELNKEASGEQTGTISVDPLTLEEKATLEILEQDEFDNMVKMLQLPPGIPMMLREIMMVEPCNMTEEEVNELALIIEKAHLSGNKDISDNPLVAKASIVVSTENDGLTLEERVAKLLDVTKVNMDVVSDPEVMTEIYDKLYNQSLAKVMVDSARENIIEKLNSQPEGPDKIKTQRVLSLIDKDYKNVDFILGLAVNRVNFLLRGWQNNINKEYNKFIQALNKEKISTMPDLTPLFEAMLYLMNYKDTCGEDRGYSHIVVKKVLYVLLRLNNTRTTDRKNVSLFIRHLTSLVYPMATKLTEFAVKNGIEFMPELQEKFVLDENDKEVFDVLYKLYTLVK